MQKTKFLLTAVAAVAVTCGVSSAQAATLSEVPMQGDMVMPMVAYHADHGHLHIMMMGMEVPQLTPLLVSHPGTNFVAGDPWYDDLDPSRQGLAFSRRYGFVMDDMTDDLPAGTAIWIRKTSGSPELRAYRYRKSPKTWQPIFGTAGSSNALYWDQMMFHPAFAAPAGTNTYTATFQAYLVDTNTGAEVAGSASMPLVLTWTSVPDGRPTLRAGTCFVVAWPAATTNYVLECADTLPASHWTPVTNAPVWLDGQPAVILGLEAARKFYRMSLAP